MINEKLVRDGIPGRIAASGGAARFRVADDAEMFSLLVKKLHEEANELLEAATREARVDELGDVMEILMALFGELGLDFHRELYKPGWKKHEELGGFTRKFVLEIPSKNEET